MKGGPKKRPGYAPKEDEGRWRVGPGEKVQRREIDQQQREEEKKRTTTEEGKKKRGRVDTFPSLPFVGERKAQGI